jgi:predicted XRE-type DNA-binding protein
MKRKNNSLTARNAKELAELLNLDPEDAIEMDLRAQLTMKIVNVVKGKRLTHAEVAKKAKASRTRVTAILNGNTGGISTDLLLRILYALGYKTKVTFALNRMAA